MRLTNLFLKRFFDIVLSVLFLLILSPLILVFILLMEMTMPGPVFFKQLRVGKNGKVFTILKLRSMKVDRVAEESHDTSKDQDRMTGLGKVMRRIKIDETPQLINVLTGSMSMVGPRPTFKEQVEAYNEKQRHRLDMRPGMTGLAQVNGNVALSWDERIEYDLQYIERFSVILDIRILIKTVLVVLFGEQKFKKRKMAK